MPLNNHRPSEDASLFMDEIQRAGKTVSKLFDNHQADWLSVQNQGRKTPHNFAVDDRVWLRKSKSTLDRDDRVLPLWEGPFAVTACLGEDRWKIRVDVNREMELSSDRLKREIPSSKGRVKPLFWTSKFLSDWVIERGNYEVKKILEAQHDAKGKRNFFVSGGALIPVTTTGNNSILLCMDTQRGSLTSSRSTPKLVYS